MATGTVPFDVATEMLFLNRAARASAEVMVAALEPFGLSVLDFEVLLLVERGVVLSSQVGEWLGVASPTVSHAVGRLRVGGWVVSEKADEDRRRRPLSLTPAGVRLLERVRAAMAAQMRVASRGADARDGRRLRGALAKWSKAVGTPFPSD